MNKWLTFATVSATLSLVAPLLAPESLAHVRVGRTRSIVVRRSHCTARCRRFSGPPPTSESSWITDDEGNVVKWVCEGSDPTSMIRLSPEYAASRPGNYRYRVSGQLGGSPRWATAGSL